MDKRYLLSGALAVAISLLCLQPGGLYCEEGNPAPAALPSPAPSVLPQLSPSPSPQPTPRPCSTPNSGPTPRTPAQKVSGGFSRYIPNGDGDILWELDGETARFLSSRLVEINRLTATSFDPEAEDLVIKADDVTYDLKSQAVATDEGRIEVRRENMVLTGKGVQWTPNGKRIRVLEDVKFLIKETDNQGMFPL